MPAFRNLKSRRSSGRIWNKAPIAYDENGWEVPDYSEMPRTGHYADIPSPQSSATSPSVTSADSDFDFMVPVSKKKSKKASQPSDPDHVPRPKNAFICFRSYFYQRFGSSDQSQLSREAGKAWKALSDEDKIPFQELAEKERREHQAKFPNYTYAPGLRTKRKKSAPKKKTQRPTTASVPQPARPRRVSRAQFESTSTPLESHIPVLSLPSPNVTETMETTPSLTNDDTPRSQPASTANSSLPAFVPTSEIPPLELSPAKSEQATRKDKDTLASSLRPPSFEISNEPFCVDPAPVAATVSSFLHEAPSFPDLHYDYTGYGMKHLVDPSEPFIGSPLQCDAWYTEGPIPSGPLEISYVGFSIPFDIYSALGVSADDDIPQMDCDQIDTSSKSPSHTTITDPALMSMPVYSPTNDCEMDQFVDYAECDA